MEITMQKGLIVLLVVLSWVLLYSFCSELNRTGKASPSRLIAAISMFGIALLDAVELVID